MACGGVLEADAVVLASGGAGQLYLHTTNPAVATGDGVAMALRAGAQLADVEFYQFHPTALAVRGNVSDLGGGARRWRGAAGCAGAAVYAGLHPDAELAPRDVVARGIAMQMAAQGGEPVMLDATALGAEFLRGAVSDDRCGLPGARVRLGAGADSGDSGGALLDGRRADGCVGTDVGCRGCLRWARRLARGCMERTGWRRTRCWRAWCLRGDVRSCCWMRMSMRRGRWRRVTVREMVSSWPSGAEATCRWIGGSCRS